MALAIEPSQLADAGYLLAAVLFILGIKGMTHPRSAVRGNALGALGMLVAVVATILKLQLLSVGLAAVAMALGAAVGLVLAVRVQLTEMPELVALFNGLGGRRRCLSRGPRSPVPLPRGPPGKPQPRANPQLWPRLGQPPAPRSTPLLAWQASSAR